VLDLLLARNKQAGTTLVLVTHDLKWPPWPTARLCCATEDVEDTLPYANPDTDSAATRAEAGCEC